MGTPTLFQAPQITHSIWQNQAIQSGQGSRVAENFPECCHLGSGHKVAAEDQWGSSDQAQSLQTSQEPWRSGCGYTCARPWGKAVPAPAGRGGQSQGFRSACACTGMRVCVDVCVYIMFRCACGRGYMYCMHTYVCTHVHACVRVGYAYEFMCIRRRGCVYVHIYMGTRTWSHTYAYVLAKNSAQPSKNPPPLDIY